MLQQKLLFAIVSFVSALSVRGTGLYVLITKASLIFWDW